MPSTKVVQRGFGGGELSPQMFGRIDDPKYQTGLETCRNFICLPQGPVQNRPGFEYVIETKYSTKKCRLIPFVFNLEQTFVIELGDKYARFHTRGATLMNGDVPYEITTPWAEADLFDLHYTQSNDVITIVHPNYAPREIRRYANTDWRLVECTFNTTLTAPTGVKAERITSAAEDQNSEKYTFQYKVSCLNADKSEESPASGAVSVTANLYAYGTTVKISCDAVSGASFYRFYKNQGGLYSYLGDSETPSIIDDNIAPKTDTTPRRFDTTISNGNWPSAVGYFEQRKVFGGFKNDPQRIIMSASSTENDLSYSLPTRDTDRINFRIASREFNQIQHIVPLAQLILLTTGAEMRVSPLNSDAITPNSISVRPQSYIGSDTVQPVIVNNNVIYASARDGHLRELAYQYQAGGYIAGDLCLRSAHLFDFKRIVDMALQKAPIPIVWSVSSDGKLLGLTYIPEQQIGSWHRHDTDGEFESCACISEDDEDHLYVVVKRNIGGQTVRFVERMSSMQFASLDNAFFVDCGATYSGDPVTTISGLTWLEGKTVAILADGAVVPQQTVINGQIKLPVPASTVAIGLPYVSDAKTLPVVINAGAYGLGQSKNVSRASLKVYKTSGIFVGPTFESKDLVEYKQRTTEPYGTPPSMVSGDLSIQLFPSWSDTGSICIRQSVPLPLTLLSLALELSV